MRFRNEKVPASGDFEWSTTRKGGRERSSRRLERTETNRVVGQKAKSWASQRVVDVFGRLCWPTSRAGTHLLTPTKYSFVLSRRARPAHALTRSRHPTPRLAPPTPLVIRETYGVLRLNKSIWRYREPLNCVSFSKQRPQRPRSHSCVRPTEGL